MESTRAAKTMSKQAVNKKQAPSTPKLKVLETDFADMRTGQTMVVPTPELIRSVIEETYHGQALTLTSLRQALATRTSAEVACPVTTSIFLRKLITAEWEQQQTSATAGQNKTSVAMLPFWRVVSPSMPLYKKLDPAIQSFLLAQRRQEGIE